MPSAQLALYECYVKGDRNFVTGPFELASSQNEGSCSLRQASMNLAARVRSRVLHYRDCDKGW